jgi:bifunctional UDP-N-acetylglucosamine pyrophosphorylase / glucosamine-1-phosphate N-acetyltransferase
MKDRKFACVIMAAGLGKRMKSDIPKVLHKLNNKPLLEYVVETAESCGAEPVIAIIGHKRELVVEQLGKRIQYAVQEKQLGTGHAVQQTEPLLKDFQGSVLILSGDVPLLTIETVNRLKQQHFAENNACTLITCIFKDPTGYGRIIRGGDNSVTAIVEHKDASEEIRKIKEINSGIYIVEAEILFEALRHIKNDNSQGEYYLPDIVPYILKKGLRVGGLVLDDPIEIAGINSQEELLALEKEYLRRRKK